MADWSDDEVRAAVGDYFAMLAMELRGTRFVKADRNRRLQSSLPGRTRGAIERKHQNISMVLARNGLPFVAGYMPLGHAQGLIETVALEFLEAQPDFFDELVQGPVLSPIEPGQAPFGEFERLVEPSPETASAAVERPERWARAAKVDFVRRDAENRRLGQLGEEWVFDLEMRRLQDQDKRPDLARRVEWSSRDRGDGLGYDISSFDSHGTVRLIEVKTTGLGKEFPFMVTSNEVRVSRRERDTYHLYRVFEFATAPRLYILNGALETTCALEPAQYRATNRQAC